VKFNIGYITIPMYLSLIPMILYGTWWQWALTAFMYFGITCLGTTVYYHRYLSHHSFKCNKWFQLVCLFFAHISLQGSALQWASVHRQHHRFIETEKDPHSPTLMGFFKAHFGYPENVDLSYVKDLAKDNMLVIQHKHYLKFMFLWIALIGILIEPFAIIYLWMLPAGLSRGIIGLILSYSHREAYPHNDEWVGWITFGEGWHDNHHQKMSSPMFHPTKDIGWWVINKVKTT